MKDIEVEKVETLSTGEIIPQGYLSYSHRRLIPKMSNEKTYPGHCYPFPHDVRDAESKDESTQTQCGAGNQSSRRRRNGF